MGSIAGAILGNQGAQKSTPQRNPLDELLAGIGFAPNLLRSQEQLQPEQIRLGQAGLDQALWGTLGGTRDLSPVAWSPRWRNRITGQVIAQDPAKMKGVNQTQYDLFYAPPGDASGVVGGSGAGGSPAASGATVPVAGGYPGLPPSEPVAATKGIVQQFLDLIAPANQANTATRTATYKDIRGLNPDVSALFDELTKSATLGLEAGSTISPEDQYRIVNPIRADNASRGFAPGGPGDLEEALALFGGGQQLLNQRQNTASGVANLGYNIFTAPTLTNSTSISPGQLLAAGSAGANVASPLGSIFDYLANAYGQNLASTNQQYNRINQMDMNTAQLASKDFGSILGAFGQGGAFGGKA